MNIHRHIASTATAAMWFVAALIAAGTATAQQPGWRQIAPTGAAIARLAATSTSIFAGTEGGVYRSMDMGITWTKLPSPLTRGFINALGIDGERIFMSTATGIYLSDDDGVTWRKASYIPSSRGIYDFLSTGTTILGAAAGSGIIRSVDHGETWSASNSGIVAGTSGGPAVQVSSLARAGGAVFAGTDNGIFRSDNDGTSWYPVNNGLKEGAATQTFGIKAVNGVVFVSSQTLYRSTDLGASWSVMPDFDNNSYQSFAVSDCGNGTIVASLGNALFKSTDLGGTWSPVGANAGGHIYATLTTGTTVFAGDYGLGIFRSTDGGGTWSRSNNGLYNVNVTALIAAGDGILACFGHSLLRTTNDGATWSAAGPDRLQTWPRFGRLGATLFAATATVVYADGHRASAIFRSTDDGVTWSQIDTTLEVHSFAGVDSTFLVSSRNFATNPNGTIDLYRTTDRGDSWQPIALDTTFTPSGAIAAAHGFMFAAAGTGVMRSADYGTTWFPLHPLPAGSGKITGMYAMDSSLVLQCNSDAWPVYYSSDYGLNWRRIDVSGFLQADPPLTRYRDGLYLAMASAGVYRSTDEGRTWSPISVGFDGPGTDVSCLTTKGTTMIATTTENGIYQTVPPASVPTAANRDALRIVACSPNPTTGTARIDFMLPARANVAADIIDARGERVARFDRGVAEAGALSITVDISALPAGAYFVRVSAGATVASSPLVLVR